MFVVTGNRLLDGIVVYLAPAHAWVEDLQQARLFDEEQSAKQAADEQGDSIVSLDVVPVERSDDGAVRAARLRERIRALGPTINPFEDIDLAHRWGATAD